MSKPKRKRDEMLSTDDCSEVLESVIPLAKEIGLVFLLAEYCHSSDVLNMAEISEMMGRAMASKWRLDSSRALKPFGVAVLSTVPLVKCSSSELPLPRVLAKTSCKQFIAWVPHCVLFFAEHNDDWLVAVHSDGCHVIGWEWSEPDCMCSMRPISNPLAVLPNVRVTLQWKTTTFKDIRSMAESSDTIAVGTFDGMVLLDAHTGAVVNDSHTGALVAFIDERRIVGVRRNQLRVFRDFPEIEQIKTIDYTEYKECVKASIDGTRLYSSHSPKREVVEYSTSDWSVAARIPLHKRPVNRFDVATNGVLLAQATSGGLYYDELQTIELIEINTRCNIRTIETEHECDIKEVAFSPDSRFITSIAIDNTVEVFDAINGQMIGEQKKYAFGGLTSVCWLTPQWFVTVSDDRSITIWHISSQQFVARIEKAHVRDIDHVIRLSNDSFATGADNGSVKKWKFEW